MTKIKAPLFSLDAAGTLDKNITYKKKLQNNIAQKYATPGSKNPFESSPRQKDQRSIIRLITIHWQCMTVIDKLAWENAAKDARFKGTGYHYFLHLAQTNLTQYLGLVGYWSMNYNIGDKIPDLSGNANHGTLSPIYPCDSPTLVDSFDKKHGKAAKFDGTNDYINISDSSIFELSLPFSIMLYCSPLIKVTSSAYTLRKDSNFASFISPGNDLLAGYNDGISWRFSYSGYSPPPSIYFHLTLTFVQNLLNTDLTFFINGLKYGITHTGVGHPFVTSSFLQIGSDSYAGQLFKGLLDDIIIFNRELSESFIKKYVLS